MKSISHHICAKMT